MKQRKPMPRGKPPVRKSVLKRTQLKRGTTVLKPNGPVKVRRYKNAEINALWARLCIPEAFEEGDCWEWPGSRNPAGYGTTKRNGENLAPRAVWVQVNGQIPAGLFVLHRCDNPPCVRPSHLFLGDKRDNALDMEAKGRGFHPLGEKNGRSTLSNQQVSEIRHRHRGGESFKAIARDVGVHPVTISRICRRLRRGELGERGARSGVRARSGGVCERCGNAPATEWHHRKNRSQGGQWSAANGMHLDAECHRWVTENPTAARAGGWSVLSGHDPRKKRVLRRGVWVRFDDFGGMTPAPDEDEDERGVA